MDFQDMLRECNIDPQMTGLIRHTYRHHEVKYLYESNYMDLSMALQNKGRFDKFKYVMSFLGFPDETCLFLRGYEVKGYLEDVHNLLSEYPYQEHINDHSVFYTLTPLTNMDEYENKLLIHCGNGQRAWRQNGSNIKPIIKIFKMPVETHNYLTRFKNI